LKNKSYSPARMRSASYNKEDNTIEVIWSAGGDVAREDYEGPFIERLSMDRKSVRLDRLNAGAPFLDSHNSEGLSNVIGSVVPGSARIENVKGIAKIQLSSAPSDADVVQKIRDGVIRNCSVGYWVFSSTRSDDEPPVVTATDWQPLEISAVAVPADASAQIRSANGRRPRARQTPAQRGAAEATRLLQSTQTRAEARGASEARAFLGSIGRMSPVGKVGNVNRREVEAGARSSYVVAQMIDNHQCKREGQPIGYQTQQIHRRATRPLHARRAAVLAAAESVFKPTEIDKRGPRNQKVAGSNYVKVDYSPDVTR
jgi:HK97 family phage prohead protease